jgi:hypothetical protein
MFPWGIFAIFSLKHLIVSIKTGKLIYPFTACWIATIFLIFQAAHSKLVSYVFPFYPAFALLIGDFIYESVSSENNKSPISLVLIVTWFLALFIPTILSLFIARSPHLPITQKSTYCFILILSILSLCVLYFILKRKPIQAVYSLMAAAPMLIFSLFFIHKDIEPHISTRKACEYLLSNNVVDNTILCSKYFARDTRYNTGKRVAIIEIAGKNFFSPHPIPFLDTDLKVKDFLTKQPVTYCLLKKSSAKDIYRIANKEFKVTQLNIIGDKYILKVESR